LETRQFFFRVKTARSWANFPGRQKRPISANLLLSLFAAIVEQQQMLSPTEFQQRLFIDLRQ